MLAEALLYLFTPAPRWARKHGYLRESIAIGARHGRQKSAWAPHLENSRRTILTAADACARREHAVILGSGHGFDLPLEDLSSRFARVTLIDAVHPLSMRWRARRLANVVLVAADVTGRHGPADGLNGEADLTVSLNLISQLGVASGDPASGRENDRAAHLDWLWSRSGIVCVIGDTERLFADGRGAVERAEPMDWPTPPTLLCDEEWIWRLAPPGEISKKIEITSRVRAAVWRGE